MIIGTAILTPKGGGRVKRDDLWWCQVEFERVLHGRVLRVHLMGSAQVVESLEVGTEATDLLYFDAYGNLQAEVPQ